MRLIQGDCLIEMKKIPDGSVDMVLADPPYGTTACKWDSIIPLKPMWAELTRVTKHNGAIVMTASQPFTTTLIASNIEMFKYCWYWKKERGTGFTQSGKRPLMIIEDIPVFHSSQPAYCPRRTLLDKPYRHALPLKKGKFEGEQRLTKSAEGERRVYKEYTHSTPHQLLEISREGGCRKLMHPTQKPVALMEYLIKTYTNKGDTVLDFAMGSGTTGVACVNLKRKFIGIELDETYFEMAQKRIKDAGAQMTMDLREEQDDE